LADELRGRAPSILEEIQQTRPFTSSGQEAYLSLVRTADEAKRVITQVLEAGGVTLQQYNVLRILRGAGEPGLPTLSIADRMIERTPGVTRILDRMEKKGWVTRERCTEDRRKVWCRITESGLALLESLDEPVSRNDTLISDVLGDEDTARFIAALDTVRAHLKSTGD